MEGGNKVLFLILGDIVDGQREGGTKVNDEMGCFELLIHILIHNLRIDAMKNKSEILFTIGNHDLETVIKLKDFIERGAEAIGDKKLPPGKEYNYLIPEIFYKKYTHDAAEVFFEVKVKDLYYAASGETIFSRRQEMLLPFYNNSPYFFINLNSQFKTEIVCVHAGIHNDAGTNILTETIRLTGNFTETWVDRQKQINEEGFTENMVINIIENWFDSSIPEDATILWERNYAKQTDICEKIKDEEPIVIVGHCPTTEFPLSLTNTNEDNYSGCDDGKVLSWTDLYNGKRRNDKRGCVSIRCRNADHTPKIVIVDTLMSQAFHKQDNKTRNVEILKLSKPLPGEAIPGNPYYKIERWLNGKEIPPPNSTSPPPPPPPPPPSSSSSSSSSSSPPPNLLKRIRKGLGSLARRLPWNRSTPPTGGRRSKKHITKSKSKSKKNRRTRR
jgi:hypothetical protein